MRVWIRPPSTPHPPRPTWRQRWRAWRGGMIDRRTADANSKTAGTVSTAEEPLAKCYLESMTCSATKAQQPSRSRTEKPHVIYRSFISDGKCEIWPPKGSHCQSVATVRFENLYSHGVGDQTLPADWKRTSKCSSQCVQYHHVQWYTNFEMGLQGRRTMR